MRISCSSVPCTLLGTSLTLSLSSRQCLEDTVFAFCDLSLLLAYAVPSTWLAVPHVSRENCQQFFQGAVQRLLPVEVSAGGSASQLSRAEALSLCFPVVLQLQRLFQTTVVYLPGCLSSRAVIVYVLIFFLMWSWPRESA